MKIDRYYDVGCDFCAKHLSVDFGQGMFETRKQAEARAKLVGFRTRHKKNICPDCLRSNRME